MSKTEKTLYGELLSLAESDMLPMHMPGHKRNKELNAFGADFDITEIEGFDDLHDPHGLIKATEDAAASLWSARRSRILTCGSTCGILAAIYAATRRGDKIIMSRACHRSVYHAVELRGLVPVYVTPQEDEKSAVQGAIDPSGIVNAIAENPDAVLVIVTSPTYEGVISDIAEIARVSHMSNIPLMVDEAHGAHLGIGGFADGAVKCGADIVIQSLHKTLSCLTQSAVLHICSDRVSEDNIAHAIDNFETSSPSYLIMASIDRCLRQIKRFGLDEWHRAISSAAKKLEMMNNLQLCNKDTVDGSFDFDVSKLTVLTGGKISGFELALMLRRDYRIEVEMASVGYIVAMSGMGDTVGSLDRFAGALLDIDGREELFSDTSLQCPPYPSVPAFAMKICDALSAESETVDGSCCRGRISAEYIFAYPPGIPIIVPGERFDDGVLEYLNALCKYGANIKSGTGCAPFKFSAVKQ